MYMLCTKDNIEQICDKILKHEISEINIKKIDETYVMEYNLNDKNTNFDKSVLAELYSIIHEFYDYFLFDRIEVFELNYNLEDNVYSLFKSYNTKDFDKDDYKTINNQAKSCFKKSLALFEKIGVDKLYLESVYSKEKNRYKNISLLEALREIDKYI